MAEAKQKSSRRATPKRHAATAGKAKSQNGSRASGPRASAKQRSRPKPRGKPAAVAEAVEGKAKDASKSVGQAGKDVGRAVSRARVPLLASGAAIAGAAGGAVLASRQAHRHGGLAGAVRKIEADDVARAARRVGDVSARMGQFAVDLQHAREASNGTGNGGHRSPVEVVLQGLTTRR